MAEIERIGRFEVLERLHSSTFSIVYRGRDPFTERSVEVKVCIAPDEGIRRRFLVAAERAARLRHANIATIYEFGSGESKPYLVQEAFSERSLGDILASGDPLEDVLKLYYLVQVARGLHHAHRRGVLHQELCPASILVRDDGRAKIADFGIGRLASATTVLGGQVNHWLAMGWVLPELLLGLELDERSDIYGFGAVAYELLTGNKLFVAGTLGELVPRVLEVPPTSLAYGWSDCPPEVARIVARCLNRNPVQRYPHTTALIQDLSSIVPMGDADDVEEEEKTIVTTELQTIFVEAESGQLSASEPAPRTKSRPWKAALESRVHRLGQSLDAAKSVAARAISLGSRFRPPRFSSPRRARVAWLGALSLVLAGVIAWGLSRAPESFDSIDVATTRPAAKGDRIEPQGTLVIDTQPWARVGRLVDDRGKVVALPEDVITPLSLQLPPGQYVALLERLDDLSDQRCEAVVSGGMAETCRPTGDKSVGVDTYFRVTGWWQ